MTNFFFKHCKTIGVVTIAGILLTPFGLRAEESVPASEAFSEGTKEFLSDPARTGSLLGTILAGAAFTNPFAPMVGSVVGFFIGKDTDYTDKPGNSKQYGYINRSLIPEDGGQVANLAGLTGKPLQEPEQTVMLELTQEFETENQSQTTEQPVIRELTRETEKGSKQQQQLASICTNLDITKPMPVHCYYYSQ